MSGPVPAHAVLRSEWTKLRSLPSAWWSAAVYAVLTGGAGWLAAATTATADGASSAVTLALIGSGFGQYAVLALGVVVGAVEFSTGTVLVSLAAVPRRVRWLAAKTVVLTAAVAVLTAVLALVCWLAARTLIAVPGGVPLVGSGVGRVLLLQVTGTALIAVLAVGLGAVLRSTAGGVSAGIGLVFLLPVLLPLFGSTGQWFADVMPVLRVGGVPFLVEGPGWVAGLAVTAGWAAAVWTLAAVLLVRRDV